MAQADDDAEPVDAGESAPPTGFSWVLVWTVLGALIPGSGLIAAGRRRLGVLLLVVLVLAGVGVAAFLKYGDVFKQGVALALDPRKLLAIAVPVAALVWALLIVLTNTQLRRRAVLSSWQAALSWLVVAVLVAGLALPAYKVSSYALITRGVVTSKTVFAGSSADTDTSAADAGSVEQDGPDSRQADPWASQPRMNVLLIGSDAGSDRTGIRPDSMILASIDTKTGNTVLFSLPRSLQHAKFAPGSPGAIAYPDGYYCAGVAAGAECLINAIWTWASTGAGVPYYKKYKNPGLRATEDAVSGVTGLKVNTYVMLNLQGFQDFINDMGGLEVNVTEKLPIGGDVEHPVATHGYLIPGKQRLTGFKALWYARSRWSTNDYDRMLRQRCVIGATFAQANTEKLALAFPKIAGTLKKNLSTGISTSDLSAWVTLAERIQKGRVFSLPFTNQAINTVNPDYVQIHAMVQSAIKDSEKPKHKKPAAGATPSPTATKSATATADPTKAQDGKQPC